MTVDHMADEVLDDNTDVSAAVTAQTEIASAPQVQDQSVVDSTATTDSMQTAVAPSWYESLGQEYAGLDEQTALERVRNQISFGANAYQQAQHYHNQAAQLQQQLQAIQQAQLAGAQQVQAQPKAPEPPKLPWEAVEFDPEWATHIDKATGQWHPNTPVSVVEGYARYQKSQRAMMNALLKDPKGTLQPIFEQYAQAQVSPLQKKLEEIETRLATQNQQSEIASLMAPYRSQLYATDANGQVQRDQYGNPIVTPDGQNFDQFTRVIQGMGVTDPRVVAAFGLLAMENAKYRNQQAAQPQQAATRQTHEQAIYQNGNGKANGVNRLANRGQTLNAAQPVGAPSQNGSISFEEAARNSLRAAFPGGLPQN